MENTTNTTTGKFIVTGLFKDKTSAECAYSALSERGYDKENTDVVMTDETRDRYYSGSNADDTELGSKALEGSGTGAAIGGTLGAIIAGIAAIGTAVVLPGIGLIVAGPLAAALVGAGAGGLAGGLLGALVGSGIPEEHAEVYESGVKSGGIVLRAMPRNAEDAAFIESKWKSCGGEQIYSNATQQTTTTARPVSSAKTTERRDTNANDVSIPVIEEELQIGKRTVESGGVNVKTSVTERPVEESVTLREEKVTVNRRPVDRAVTDADRSNIKEGDFDVTTRSEEAVVGKQSRVVEEVVVGKEMTERTETVRDTVRQTDVEVEEMNAETDKTKSQKAR
jgi:uncharacterized protein (TIGR02271 family)